MQHKWRKQTVGCAAIDWTLRQCATAAVGTSECVFQCKWEMLLINLVLAFTRECWQLLIISSCHALCTENVGNGLLYCSLIVFYFEHSLQIYFYFRYSMWHFQLHQVLFVHLFYSSAWTPVHCQSSVKLKDGSLCVAAVTLTGRIAGGHVDNSAYHFVHTQ